MCKYITLEDQIPLSQNEYNNILKLIDKNQSDIKNREEYCLKNNLDLSLYLPGGQWTRQRGVHMYPCLEKLLDRKYDTINNLRMYCWPFTGYCRYAEVYNTTYEDFNSKLDTFKINNDIFKISTEDNISLNECISILDTTSELLNYLFSVPIRFGEFGIFYKDKIINHDVKCSLEQLAVMYEAKILDLLQKIEKDRPPVIVEIGAGYGKLAYQMIKNFPTTDYTIVDIPESLLFSSSYLSTVLPNSNIKFVNNYEINNLNLKNIDLIINTISMSEFTVPQVQLYCEKLQPLLNNKGLFFDNNEDRKLAGFCNCSEVISNYFSLKEILSMKYIPYKHRSNCWYNIWGKKNV